MSSHPQDDGETPLLQSQLLLDLNEDLIAAIVENLQLGRHDDCVKHYNILQQNLVTLATALDKYPHGESDPFEAVKQFPDEIIRKDILEDFVSHEDRTTPIASLPPPCVECASNNCTSRVCRIELGHVGLSCKFSMQEREQFVKVASVLSEHHRDIEACAINGNLSRPAPKKWNEHEIYTIFFLLSVYGDLKKSIPKIIEALGGERNESMIRSKMKTLCKKQHKEVDAAIHDKILPEAPYGYLPPSSIVHLYNQAKSSSNNNNNVGNKSANVASSTLPTSGNSHSSNPVSGASAAPINSKMTHDNEINITTSSLAPRKGEDWVGLIAIATADNPSSSNKDVSSHQNHALRGLSDSVSPRETSYVPYDEKSLGNSVMTILNNNRCFNAATFSETPATPSNAVSDAMETNQYVNICKNVVKEICMSTISSVSMLAPHYGRGNGHSTPRLDEAPPFAKQGLLLQKKIWHENIFNQKNSFKEHLKEYISCAIQAYQCSTEPKQVPVDGTAIGYSTKKRLSPTATVNDKSSYSKKPRATNKSVVAVPAAASSKHQGVVKSKKQLNTREIPSVKNMKKITKPKGKKGFQPVVKLEPSTDSVGLYNLINSIENVDSKTAFESVVYTAAFDDAFLTESLLGFGELSRDSDSRLNNNHVLSEISMIPGLNNDYSFAGPSWKK